MQGYIFKNCMAAGEEKVAAEGEGKNGGGELQKSYFDVLGICCSSEIPMIENILKEIEGIKEIRVIVATRTLIVLHDNLLVSQSQIGMLSLSLSPSFSLFIKFQNTFFFLSNITLNLHY